MRKSLNTTLYAADKFYKYLRCYSCTIARLYLEHQRPIIPRCTTYRITVAYHYAST